MELGRSAGAHRADRGGGIVRTVAGVWRGERVTDRELCASWGNAFTGDVRRKTETRPGWSRLQHASRLAYPSVQGRRTCTCMQSALLHALPKATFANRSLSPFIPSADRPWNLSPLNEWYRQFVDQSQFDHDRKPHFHSWLDCKEE